MQNEPCDPHSGERRMTLGEARGSMEVLQPVTRPLGSRVSASLKPLFICSSSLSSCAFWGARWQHLFRKPAPRVVSLTGENHKVQAARGEMWTKAQETRYPEQPLCLGCIVSPTCALNASLFHISRAKPTLGDVWGGVRTIYGPVGTRPCLR